MTRRSKVPLRAAFLLGVGALLLVVVAVMLEPAVLGPAGDALRKPAASVGGNWVLLAAVLFPTLMLGFLLVLRGAT